MAAVSSDEVAVLRDNMRKLQTVKHTGLMQLAARTTKACETVLSLTENDIAADEDFMTLRKSVSDMASWFVVIDETLDSLPKKLREKVKEKVRGKGKLSKTLKNIATLGKSASSGWSGFQQRPNLADMIFLITKRIEQFKLWLHNSRHGAEFPLHITNDTAAGSLTLPEPPQNEVPAARIYGDGSDTSSRSDGMEDATTIKCRIELQRNQTPPVLSSDPIGPDGVSSEEQTSAGATAAGNEPNEPNPDDQVPGASRILDGSIPTVECFNQVPHRLQEPLTSAEVRPGEDISSEVPRATIVSEPDVPQADQQVSGPSRAENGGSDNFDQRSQPFHEPGTGQLAPEERADSRTGIPEEGEHQPNGSHSHTVPTADPRDPPEDEFVPVNDIEPGEEGDVMPSGFFALPEPYDGERMDDRHSGVRNDAESDSSELDMVDFDVVEDCTQLQYDFLIYHEENDTSAAKDVKDLMTAYFCDRNTPPRIALMDDFHYEGILSHQLQAAVQRCTLAMFFISENTKDRSESMLKELHTLMVMSDTQFNSCIKCIFIIGHGNLNQMTNYLENETIPIKIRALVDRGYLDVDAPDFLKKMHECHKKYNRFTLERERRNAHPPHVEVNTPVNPNVYQATE